MRYTEPTNGLHGWTLDGHTDEEWRELELEARALHDRAGLLGAHVNGGGRFGARAIRITDLWNDIQRTINRRGNQPHAIGFDAAREALASLQG